jgi:predicted metal-dependent phosphotriesterase family hydrolase
MDHMNDFKSQIAGKVQTVLGHISPNEMGITLSHEHVLMDLTCIFQEPEDEEKNKQAYELE